MLLLPIYLASSSPRRRELMEQMGLRFSVVSRPVDETVDEKLPPEEVVKSLSARKALAVSREIDRGLVIGSDTVVVWQGKIMGKPVSDDYALIYINRYPPGMFSRQNSNGAQNVPVPPGLIQLVINNIWILLTVVGLNRYNSYTSRL